MKHPLIILTSITTLTLASNTSLSIIYNNTVVNNKLNSNSKDIKASLLFNNNFGKLNQDSRINIQDFHPESGTFVRDAKAPMFTDYLTFNVSKDNMSSSLHYHQDDSFGVINAIFNNFYFYDTDYHNFCNSILTQLYNTMNKAKKLIASHYNFDQIEKIANGEGINILFKINYYPFSINIDGWITPEIVQQNTIYIDKDGKQISTSEKDLSNINSKEIIQIGFYQNYLLQTQVVSMPRTVEKIPNKLPAAITSLKNMFAYAISFNQDISKWDTSNVTDMSYMFYGAKAFNQDLSKWNVIKVTDHTDFNYDSGIDDTNKLPKFKKAWVR